MKIEVTVECYNMARAQASNGWSDTAGLMDNGNMLVNISEVTFERVQHFAFEGESFSDTVIRMLCSARH